MRRIWELARHPVVRDAGWASLILLIGVIDIASHPHSDSFPGSVAANLAFLAGSAVPLAARHRSPIAVSVVAVAGITAWDAALYPPQNQASFEAFLIMLTASYILGGDPRGRRQLVATALVGLVILPGWLFAVGVGQSPGNVFPALVFTILAWVVAFTLRRRREQAAVERARADRLAFEEGRLAAEAVIEERSRIARELHDVVAHSLSLMVVQASAEHRALRAGNSDLAATEQVLESVETTGREALVELRRLLGLLRRNDESPSRQPQPSLRHLDTLIGPLRDNGIEVSVAMPVDCSDLPPGVDLAAFRIVQESLTNVVKHAGADRVDIRINRERETLDITVTDNGNGSGSNGGGLPLPRSGHGLVGMRERVAIYDGALDAGPVGDAPGFRVHVRLPVRGAVAVQR